MNVDVDVVEVGYGYEAHGVFVKAVQAVSETSDGSDVGVPVRVVPVTSSEAADGTDAHAAVICKDKDVTETAAGSDTMLVRASETNTLQGYCRMENTSLARYEVYVGTDAMPTLTDDPVENPPTYTFTVSPKTFSLAAGHTYYLCTRYRGSDGICDGNVTVKVVTISAGGELVTAAPSAPINTEIKGASGGRVEIKAIYDASESDPADKWKIYKTEDGSTPDPTNAGHLYQTIAMATGDPVKRLDWTSTDIWASGTVIKIVVTASRTADGIQSPNTVVSSYTVDTTGPVLYGGGAILNEGADI